MRILFITILVLVQYLAEAQYFQFSLFDIANQRTNPAESALSGYASLNVLYRQQSLPHGQSFQSSYLQATYPVKYSRTVRASYGISVLDDRYGIAGIYRTNMVGPSYAMALQVAKDQYLGLGVKVDWQVRSVSLNGLTTGAQFVPDRGFQNPSNEPLGNFQSSFVTGSMGLFWERYMRDQTRVAHFGIALYDFNRPADSYYNQSGKLPQTWVVSSGINIPVGRKVALYPGMLYTYSGSLHVLNLGMKTSYELRGGRDSRMLEVLTRCTTGRNINLGLQWVSESMIIGTSYDLPFGKRPTGTAFEVGIVLRKLVAPKRYVTKRRAFFRERAPGSPVPPPAVQPDTLETAQKPVIRDEPEASGHVLYAYPGQVVEMRVPQVSDTIRFYFPTDASFLDQAVVKALMVTVDFLKANDDIDVLVTGHTDDVGSHSYNYRLGMKRAGEIAGFLEQNGIDINRIYVESEGEDEPLAPNLTEESRSKNRRVDVSFSRF